MMDSNRSPWRQGPLVTLLLLVAAGLAEAQPRAYVASTSAGLVTAIDTLTNTPVGTIPVGVSPTRVAVSGDGTKRRYVADSASASVSVIDTASDAVVATIGLGGNPSALAVTPDGARLYVLLAERSRVGGTLLERFGHEVIVADPNFAPMYAARSRKIKTDRRDARALAEACRLGAYRPTHRLRGSRSSAVEPSRQGRRN